jgi:hypothetical protein
MSRTPLQTVTLPILTEARDANRAEGYLASFGGGRSGWFAVNAINPQDIVNSYEHLLSRQSLDVFRGLLALRRGYEGRRRAAVAEAFEHLRPYRPKLPPGVTETLDLTGEKIWDGARWEYSEFMSRAMNKARLVTWFPASGARVLSPGVYCPDTKTAVFAAAFSDAVRVCPKCKALFTPSSNFPNQAYCTPAHGGAHRTQLSRDRKRARALVDA